MLSKDNTELARKKFFDQFKEKTGQNVLSVEFATLTASLQTFSLLELDPPPGQNELAGLLVFCEESLYFYVFPTDNIFRLAMQRMAGDMENKEQCFCLSELSDVKILYRPKKSFRFLFPKQSRTILVNARHKEKAADFTLCLMHDAAPIIDQITSRLSLSSQNSSQS